MPSVSPGCRSRHRWGRTCLERVVVGGSWLETLSAVEGPGVSSKHFGRFSGYRLHLGALARTQTMLPASEFIDLEGFDGLRRGARAIGVSTSDMDRVGAVVMTNLLSRHRHNWRSLFLSPYPQSKSISCS